MGIFDGIEKLITEHGSAAILKERLALVADKYSALEKKVANLESENRNLKVENGQLKEQKRNLEEQLKQRHGQRLEEVQARIAERMFPKHREPVLLNLAVVDQRTVKIRQGTAFRQHRREQDFLFAQSQSLACAQQNLNMPRRTGMAEFIEHFLRVHFHQVNILDEKPQVLVKSRGVNRVDHRHESAPVFIKELDGFLLEFSLPQLIHETRLIDGLFPASVALGGQLGDKFLRLAFIHF